MLLLSFEKSAWTEEGAHLQVILLQGRQRERTHIFCVKPAAGHLPASRAGWPHVTMPLEGGEHSFIAKHLLFTHPFLVRDCKSSRAGPSGTMNPAGVFFFLEFKARFHPGQFMDSAGQNVAECLFTLQLRLTTIRTSNHPVLRQ
jgi:hypothetical protein